ncbi:MAG: GAF and HD-GYP domain-containing protein [Cellulosilyticaceae bacterium]
MVVVLVITTLMLFSTLLVLGKVHRNSVERLNRMSRVCQIGTKFDESTSLNGMVSKIIEAATNEIHANHSFLYLISDVKNELYSEIAIRSDGVTLESKDNLVEKEALEYVILTKNTINEYSKRELKAKLSIPVVSEKKIIGVLVFERLNTKKGFSAEDQKLMELLVELQIVSSIAKAKLYNQLKETMVDAIRTLVSVIDAKDKYTVGHCQRVSKYAEMIGRELCLCVEDREDLEFAAILHDIGKIGISDAILNKAGKLNDEEYLLIKEHPIMGGDILQKITRMRPAIIYGAKYHHERYDGTGYGQGLKGEEIPLFARIISIADAYDAMVGKRIYRTECSAENAIKELRAGAWSQFDGHIVECFAEALKKEGLLESK